MCFELKNKRFKQINSCPMGQPIPVVFPDNFICKMEENAVIPANSIFYKRNVDDTYVRGKRNETDRFLIDLIPREVDVRN